MSWFWPFRSRHAAGRVSARGTLVLLLIPVGIAVNIVGGQIASLLKLPLYLDSIGTMLIAAVCGPLSGGVVGAASNLINSATNPTLLPYMVDSFCIGLVTGWCARYGVFRRLWPAAIFSAVVIGTIVSGGIGALTTIYVFGGLSGSGDALIAALLHAFGISLDMSALISTVAINVIDKLISGLVVYTIVRRMPQRIIVKLPLGKVYLGRSTGRKYLAIPDSDLAIHL